MSLGIADRVWSGVRSLARDASETLDAKLNEHRIRLAVTGLSRSGKTVFITSLIHNLLALGAGRDTLPRISRRLSQGGRSRIRRIRLLPTALETLPHFEFREYLTRLAGSEGEQPKWPERTQNLSQISLTMEVEHESALKRRLGNKRIRLDIMDYPGEWLLDLPLLDRSFEEWSVETIDALMSEPRRTLATGFVGFLREVGAGDPADEAVIRRGHELYRRTLVACKEQVGLNYLQPGRFLCPGPQGSAPFMWFFPVKGHAGPAAAGSIGGLLNDRFETYKRQIRTDFFDVHFKAFDRQIVLVDALGALYAGETAFHDTFRAISELAIGLRGGWGYWNRRRRQAVSNSIERSSGVAAARAAQSGGWAAGIPIALASTALSAMVAPRAVERVAFVATKADHVSALNRDHLRNLLEALCKPAAGTWEASKANVSYHVAASIRSTEDGTAMDGGRAIEVVRGVPLGEEKVRPFDVGQVPSAVPPSTFWTRPYFQMPVFRPPIIDMNGAVGIRHLNLDEVLDAVIGDLL